MTVFEYIGENIERLKKDIKIGITSYCIINHWYIYSRYHYYISVGNPVSNAVLYTSQDFKIGERTIYKIIKRMEATI